MKPGKLVGGYQSFAGTYCIHLRILEDEGSVGFRKAGNYVPDKKIW
jgi:hypothetical protein